MEQLAFKWGNLHREGAPTLQFPPNEWGGAACILIAGERMTLLFLFFDLRNLLRLSPLPEFSIFSFVVTGLGT